MRIKSITIVFEDEEVPDGEDIAAAFRDGKWIVTAPMFSRFHAALHDVWKILREVCRNGGA